MEQIRSFIAIELPEDLKLSLTRLQERLKSESRAPVKWVNPNNMHLTLKFLGNIDAGVTGKITSALEEAVRGTRPFHLEIKGLGVFPNPRRVNIVWVGITGEVNQLDQLQKRVESSLTPLGFVPESRPFTPHLTLARLRDQATSDERLNLGQLIANTEFDANCNLYINSVHLVRSQLTREGPFYSHISSIEIT